ncbi:MAG: hypothetical protein JHD16_03055 [Solirubrobacteraceae bacterium]|nr:hypothetical protein [Solirubrobacteraceae bacterium]
MKRCLVVPVAVVVVLRLAGTAGAAAQAVELTPGPSRDSPVFSVKYTGSSKTETTYRATPPNPGGAADLNTAHDRGRASWAITFPGGLSVPSCAGEGQELCAALTGVAGARGKTSASADIDHDHVDGLYDQLDASSRCRLRSRAVPRKGLSARIDVVYDGTKDAFVVTARNPVSEALIMLPAACPDPVDGIDRILSNYATPGFSFAREWGADRWFSAEPVAIPAAAWHASSRIRLRFGPAVAARPPRDCAARFTYERCRTSGSWSGVLTFTAR